MPPDRWTCRTSRIWERLESWPLDLVQAGRNERPVLSLLVLSSSRPPRMIRSPEAAPMVVEISRLIKVGELFTPVVV